MAIQVTKNRSLNEWLNILESRHNKKIDLGLTRIQQVYNNCKLAKIAPTIITVAGTNGKGSTVAILSSICQSAEYKVGEFTSPHILKYNERIKVNSQNATDQQIIDAFKKVDENLNGISLSYFEYATLAAIIIFKQQNVDIAILEVGLGGRLDSVNVIDTDCAIITTIDIDHTSWLGNDKESIAFEKAGIMRINKPVIYGDEDCPASIIKHAKKTGAKLIFADQFEENRYPNPNLLGQYQLKNAATAITALHSIHPRLNISEDSIKKGLKDIKLSGRLQTIAESPNIIVDVAHNKQACESLNSWLQSNPCQGKTIAVFSVLDDKKAMDWLDIFKDSIDVWCISVAQSERAMPIRDLLNVLVDSARLVTSFPSINEAFVNAQIMASPEDRIIVFGSFYSVSEVMQNSL